MIRFVRPPRRLTSLRRCSPSSWSLRAATVSGCQGRSWSRCLRQQVQQEGGIGGVVFGPAGVEGFPIARQRLGIDRVEHQKLVLHQRVDHRAAPLFDGQAHRAAAKPFAELGHPAVQHVRPLLEGERFHRATPGRLELHRVPVIAPVQSDVRRQLLFSLHGPSSSGTRI